MKLERLWRTLWTDAWAISPSAHAALAHIVWQHITGEAHAVDGIAALFDEEDKEREPLCVDGGVAIVPVDGVIGRRVSGIERSSGVTDVLDLAEMLDECEQRDDVDAVLLDVDSPGGTITGVPEIATRIATLTKPVLAWTGSEMASAAYWIACGADAIYAERAASIGSIGAYIPIIDRAREYEMQGLKVEMFASGPLKGAGYPGLSLSDEQRKHFQASADSAAKMFKDHVLEHRRMKDEHMQGQALFAEEAMKAGMIDQVASFQQALEDARLLCR